ITPTTINKSVRKRIQNTFVAEENENYDVNKVTEFSKDEIEVIIENLNTEMLKAAEELDFERAATLRDQIRNLKNTY
ncbi:MAG: UvrB/UvrC motif-containing protein, partial [Finegoldia magna]